MIELKDVFKSYGEGDQKQPVLDNMTWSFSDGQFTALLGKSGSGKSTVLNLLSGLDQPDKGQVILNGEDLYGRTDKNLSDIRLINFGFIFQSFNLISNLTAYENIEYPLYLLKKGPEARKKKVMEILEQLELSP